MVNFTTSAPKAGTLYSRGADGRLTLKGGVREVLESTAPDECTYFSLSESD